MQESRKKEIRMKADRFRRNCKVSRYAIMDLFKECDRLGYRILRYPLGDEADLGFTIKKDNDIIIFTNSCSRLSREIFTLAHELGHAALHMEHACSFVDNMVTISNRTKDEKEHEANYFAACLLMPKDEVDKFLDFEIEDFSQARLTALDIARMMSEFHVSFETVLNRLENLGKISNLERIRLDNEKNQTRVGKLLRSVGGSSRLNEAGKEIGIPFEYLNYVIYNYNRKAVPLETLKKVLAYYELTIDDIEDRIVSHVSDCDNLEELIGGLED